MNFREREEQGRLGWILPGIVPALNVADCENLTELPKDLQVRGPIELAGSGLRDLPSTLSDAMLIWRRVRVPAEVVFHPERLRPDRVLLEENAELRRVMLERVGLEAILEKAGSRTIHADTDAGDPRKLLAIDTVQRTYLLCSCSSTRRRYLLRVPPTMQTCHQAAAWIAGFDDPSRYRPELET